MPTNILHVYKTSLPYTQGGIEEVIHQTCRATSPLGIINRVACISRHCQKKEIIETPEATVYCYPMNFEVASCGFSWQLWLDFKKLSEWADVIHYQFPWPFADILALTRQNKTPYIVSYQSDIVRQQGLNKLYKPLMEQFLKKAAAIVATSPQYIKSSVVLNQANKNVTLIPNGIDSTPPSPAAFQQERADYNQLYGSNFFLFIGIFRYYKGLNYLLEAAKKTGLPLVIVGDGPEAGELHRYAQENKLKNVHFLGHVNDEQKYALISLTKALILPSSERSEAYGMVLLEAARQGAAMISTELGSGTSYINTHNETGLVVAAKSTKELSDAMQYFDDNDNIVSKMAILAKQRFNERFTAEIMGAAYSKLYQAILTENES